MDKIFYLSYQNYFSGPIQAGSTLSNGINGETQNFALHTLDSLSEIDRAQSNRKYLQVQLDQRKLITLRQTHSDIIHCITRQNQDYYANNPLVEGDAIITNLSDVLIGILTADCVPLLFYDTSKQVIAACHAGWKGIRQNIHLKIIDSMIQEYRSSPSDVQVVIGPHIRSCCYEVSTDFTSHFDKQHFHYPQETPYFDMASVITHTLQSKGITENNITDTKLCVHCDQQDRFFSYRNSDKYHRNLSFITITGNNT